MEFIKSFKVSICIPCYNYAHFLSDAIESVLKQTYKNLELIIIDNCSKDNTREIVQDYLDIDNRIRYFCNKTNIGMVENWNRCLEESTGEYVKILCADDLLEPYCIEKSLTIFENYPQVVLVTVGRSITTSDLQSLNFVSYSRKFEIINGIEVIKKCIIKGNIIGEPSAVLFRRENAMRGFCLSYKQIPDLEMWIHILEDGYLASIPDCLCKIRQHGLQVTKENIRSLDFGEEEFVFLEECFHKKNLKFNFIEKHNARVNKAFIVWKLSHNIFPNKAKKKISKNYRMLLYYSLLLFNYLILHIKYLFKAK